MSKLRLTFACGPYDRMQSLMNGTIVPEGIDLNFIPLPIEEISWRQLKHQEFDCSESSFSNYILGRSQGDERFIAIPVFTSKSFRHSCIYINVHKGIKTPQDLKGKTVGVPVYPMTAAVWIRGILQHEYGVSPADIHWRGGGEENPGRLEKFKLSLPADVDYQPIPMDKTLSRMLDLGEIDGLVAARAPSCFTSGSPNVKRLFDNCSAEEEKYYLKTGIFPIMHCVVIKRAVYEANPWVAKSLYNACLASKDVAVANLHHSYALLIALPWLIDHVSKTITIMGADWWSYGVEKNKKNIETLCQYSFEQGLATRRMTIEELFAPGTLDEFKI